MVDDPFLWFRRKMRKETEIRKLDLNILLYAICSCAKETPKKKNHHRIWIILYSLFPAIELKCVVYENFLHFNCYAATCFTFLWTCVYTFQLKFNVYFFSMRLFISFLLLKLYFLHCTRFSGENQNIKGLSTRNCKKLIFLKWYKY